MTDQNETPDMNDPTHDRAERALRLAFSAHAEAVDATPLDPDLLLAGRRHDAGSPAGRDSRTRRRRPAVWLSAAAAVAAVVLGVPIVLGLGGMGLRGQPSAAGGAAPEMAPGPRPASDIGGAAGQDSASRPADGAAVGGAPGTRPVSFLDVVVDVPVAWGYDVAPGPDWCAEPRTPRPNGPYVDRNPLSRGVRSILCTGTIPDSEQQTHLTWRRLATGDAAASVMVGAWVTVSRPVGSAYVSVTVPVGQEQDAWDILDSARVVDVDPNGCPVRLPGGPPAAGSLADLAGAASAAVCQYVLDGSDGPDLAGSYRLDGEDADALFRSMLLGDLQAVAGGAPACSPTGDVLVVRFADAADAERVARLSLNDGCGSGWYDGVSVRPPSRVTCGDLLVGPLGASTFDGRWAGHCTPR